MKRIAVLSLVLFLFLVFVPAHGAGSALPWPILSTAPTVDGVVSPGEWDTAQEVLMHKAANPSFEVLAKAYVGYTDQVTGYFLILAEPGHTIDDPTNQNDVWAKLLDEDRDWKSILAIAPIYSDAQQGGEAIGLEASFTHLEPGSVPLRPVTCNPWIRVRLHANVNGDTAGSLQECSPTHVTISRIEASDGNAKLLFAALVGFFAVVVVCVICVTIVARSVVNRVNRR